jgi:hypothetical protein
MLIPHLTEFTLDQIDGATARRDETAEQRTKRLAAIRAMYQAYEPRDGIEDMFVGQIIAMRFLVADAMKRVALLAEDSRDGEIARKEAGTLSRILLSWVGKLDQRRARDAKRQAESAKQQPESGGDRPAGTLRLPTPAVQSANGAATAVGANGAARPPVQPSSATPGVSTPSASQLAAGGPVRPQPANVTGGPRPAGNNAGPAGTPVNGAGPRQHAATA